MNKRFFVFCLLLQCFFLFENRSSAQVVLGASPYTQTFDGLGAGLPTGWSGRIGVTSMSLGAPGTFVAAPGAATAWAQTTGNFRNCASADAPSTAADVAATQTGRADRALAVKTTGSFGDGQHAFALQLANTTGMTGFQLSFKAQLLDVQTRTLTYLIDYGFGAVPVSFSQAAAPFTFTDLGINGGAWGQTTINVNFGNALDNNAGNVWIRISNITPSTGAGSRCTFGIDDVSLSWSLMPATVSLSSPNPSVAAGNIIAGSTNNLLYRADVTVANASTSLTALNLNTGGTYVAADLANLKLWYQPTSTFNSGTASLITTKTTGLGAGLQSFSGFNRPYAIGTGYLFVTADLACAATATNTINVNTPLATDFVFGATIPTGTLFAGGAQQFTGLAPSNVTGVTCSPGNGEIDIAWVNPSCYDEIMIVATDDAGGVTSVPTGNGSQYTQNTVYNDGTNFANLNPNEFCIYKGSASPVTMTNLVNGITYRIKIFTRIGTTWSSGATCATTPVPAVNGDFRTVGSGNWDNYAIWEKFSGSWVATLPGEYPNSQTSSVTIQATNVVILNQDGISVRSLTINATGKLYCNTYLTNRYLSVFGSITCNGTIGNAPTQDYICFNIEGATCNVSGTGSFNCNRIRKNTGVNLTSNLNINMNITTWWTGTAIYNNYNGDPNAFNVTIAAGRTVNCSNGGSYAIDGQTGTTPGSSYGTTTVNGTLSLSSTLYLTCFNPAGSNCTVNIGTAGTINASAVSMNTTSGGAQHFFSIASGGRLNINGTTGISPFSTTSNNYTLTAGSTIEYSAAGATTVESGLSYSNLTISGSGTKTSNGNISVGGIFTLAAGTFSQNVAPNYYTTTIGANGTLTGNGGNFVAGNAGGTVSFTGIGTINGTTALGFNILTINAGTVTNSLTGSSADSLNLTGGVFTIGTGNLFHMLNAGVVTAVSGNFATGATGGILNFQGGGKFIGNSSPYDVYASGGVDFGTGTVTIQGGGSFRINAGGYANTNGCFYANNSTLVYNNGSTFVAGTEWYAVFASGRGVPYHVQIGTSAVNNTKVDFGTSNAWRQMNGDLYIGPSSGGSNYGLILSTVFGGDILVGGSWTRATTASFTPNTRSVTFNGGSVSNVTVLGGGTETFAYLLINKSAGVSTTLAAAPNATNVTVNGGGGGNVLQLINGDIDLNGRTLRLENYFNANQNNIGIDGTAGNLTRNIKSAVAGGIFMLYNSTIVTHTLTIARMSGNASVLVYGTNVTLTNGGVGAGGAGINFGSGLTTINGTLQLNAYGFVTGNAPFYGINSYLIYNNTGTFDRNVEFCCTSGAGYPYHVTIQNNTTVRLNTVVNGNADRAMAGNLNIVAGSTLLFNETGGNKLTVAGNVQMDGTITMPLVVGADIYIGGNWNRSATGVFTANDRAVFFYGPGNSTITANGGQLFPYLYLTKNALANTLTLLDDISISKQFGITAGTFELAAKNATLKSDASGTASFGQVGALGDVTYSGVGRFIVERYIPTGTLGGQHIKSWQFLAVPDNGGQTINAGWQEGNVLPTVGTAGLGTIISNNIAGAGFDIIGGAGPSIKTWNSAGAGSWVGVPNTTPTALFNQKGYFLFVRGDRTVTAYNQAATATTLRSTGKLFVPGSNPPASTVIPAGSFESIGNPYASAIDFLNITRPAAPAVDSVFYVWDPLLAGTWGLGGFQTISAVTGWKPTPGGTANYSGAIAYTKIQSGQAFMMHATGAGGTVSFTESAKIAGSDLLFRQENNSTATSNRSFLRAQLYTTAGNIADANVVAFDNAFSNGYETNDALKIINAGENFGIKNNNKALTIDARESIAGMDTVFYTISNLRTQNYQLRFGPENFPNQGLKALLVDRFLRTRTEISLIDSSFVDFAVNNDPGSAAANRFLLVFRRNRPVIVADAKEKQEILLVNTVDEPGISIYPNPVVDNIRLNFENQPAGTYLCRLMNSSGQVVMERQVAVSGIRATIELPVAMVSAGLYRLSITTGKGTELRVLPVVIQK